MRTALEANDSVAPRTLPFRAFVIVGGPLRFPARRYFARQFLRTKHVGVGATRSSEHGHDRVERNDDLARLAILADSYAIGAPRHDANGWLDHHAVVVQDELLPVDDDFRGIAGNVCHAFLD